MDTSLPWAADLNFRPSTLALMMGFTPAYVPKLEELSGITAARQEGTPNRFFDVDSLFRLARFRRQRSDVAMPSRQVQIAVYLPKGGVGKTTTTIELGMQLAIKGAKVLLVDLDSQGDMSQALGYDPDMTDQLATEYKLPPGLVVNATVADLFDLHPISHKAELDTVLKKPFGEYGPHLVPADVSLIDFEEYLTSVQGREQRLAKLMQSSRDGLVSNMDVSSYDFVLYDCPPGASTLTTNALLAADIVLSPVSLTMFSTKGIARFGGRLSMLKEVFGYSPDVITVPVMFEGRLNRVADSIQLLRNYFKDTTLETSVRKSEEMSAALDARLPMSLFKPKNKVAEDYRAVAEEIVQRAINLTNGQGNLPGVR